MNKLRVLMTNNTLAGRAGTELYLRDVAIELVARGHQPIAYSTALGEVAEELRRASVSVVDDLSTLSEPPDVIHGQHHLDTMTALLHFPGTPVISVCHGVIPWLEKPPRHPRILRYVAVDEPCRDRLLEEHGIPRRQIELLLNFVDLERFPQRAPLPAVPGRALILDNHVSEHNFLPAVREACETHGIVVEAMGSAMRAPCANPEEQLQHFDLTFATGRSAIEALAVGNAVILCSKFGLGPLVTTREFERLRPLNFGLRALRPGVTRARVEAQLALYDARDARVVSDRIREEANLAPAVDKLIDLYRRVIAESRGYEATEADWKAASNYLQELARDSKILNRQVSAGKREIAELQSRAETERRRSVDGGAQQKIAELRALLESERAASLRQRRRVESVLQSRSWRLTRPLRRLKRVLAAFSGR